MLLESDRNEAADALIARYEDDHGTEWAYGRALLAFRAEGDTPAARAAVLHAIRVNPHVARFLVAPDQTPMLDPPYVTLGGPDEAIGLSEAFAPAFEKTAGALQWLEREASRALSSRGRGPARRRRKP
jgi:hypothetical protein